MNLTLARLTLAMVALVAMLVAVRPVMAQESASDFVQPRIDRKAYAAFIGAIGLERDQMQIVNLIFSDYASALDELIERLDAEADVAGRQKVQTALAGRARLEAGELQQLRLAVLSVYEAAGPAADEELENLVLGIEIVLRPEQQERFAIALRALRREVLLHSRQAASGYQEYAGDGLDVLELAAAALAPGGELAEIGPAALQPILTQYEHQLDALLSELAAGHRDGVLRRKLAGIEKDTAALRQEEQDSIERWRMLYQLNETTVKQIGDFAASAPHSAGEAARQAWIDRFEQASFAWLFPRRKPDRQIEWIRANVSDSAVIGKAEVAYSSYVATRRTLSRAAMDMMIRARLEFQTLLHPMMDPTAMDDRIKGGLWQELLKNSGEQATLETNAASALEALLTDAQRDDLRDAMKRPDRVGPRR